MFSAITYTKEDLDSTIIIHPTDQCSYLMQKIIFCNMLSIFKLFTLLTGERKYSE